MIQRLLRGWVAYLVLGAVAVGLYARGGPSFLHQELKTVHMSHETSPTAVSSSDKEKETSPETLEWWPKELTRSALTQRVTQQPRLFLLVSALSTIIGGLMIGGLWLSVGLAWTGRLRSLWRFPTSRLPRWSPAEVVRMIILFLVIASLMPFVRLTVLAYLNGEGPDDHLWITTSMLFLDCFIVLTIGTFALAKGSSVWKVFIGSSRHVLRNIGVGIRGYITAFPWIFALLFLVVEATRHFGFKPPMEPIQELIFQEHRPVVLGLTIILACLIGPIAEECFFRGVIYAAIRQRTSSLTAMLLSGGFFALLHTNWVGFLPILLLGMLLAQVYERSGSLISSVTVHIIHNTLLMSMALLVRYVTTPS